MDVETNRKTASTAKSSSSFNPFGDSGKRKNDDGGTNDEGEASKYNPINYQFAAKMDKSRDDTKSRNNSKKDQDDNNIPDTGWRDMENNGGQQNNKIDYDEQRPTKQSDKKDKNNINYYANPRRDAVTRYTSTKMGKLKLCVSSVVCGGLLGMFVGKSVFGGDGKQIAMIFA